MDSESFTSIPNLPGYAVNARGQVMGKRGVLLHDAKGCVNVRQGASVRKMYPGELLSLAGWHRPDDSGQEAAEAAQAALATVQQAGARQQADARIAELEAQLTQAQAETELARSRATRFEKRLDELALESVDTGKKRKASPSADAMQALKIRCSEAEARCQKAIAQRDNLAARLLTMRVELANAKARAKTVKCSGGRMVDVWGGDTLEEY